MHKLHIIRAFFGSSRYCSPARTHATRNALLRFEKNLTCTRGHCKGGPEAIRSLPLWDTQNRQHIRAAVESSSTRNQTLLTNSIHSNVTRATTQTQIHTHIHTHTRARTRTRTHVRNNAHHVQNGHQARRRSRPKQIGYRNTVIAVTHLYALHPDLRFYSPCRHRPRRTSAHPVEMDFLIILWLAPAKRRRRAGRSWAGRPLSVADRT